MMNFPNSVGIIGIGSAPKFANFAFNAGSARTALISLLSLSTISGAALDCSIQSSMADL